MQEEPAFHIDLSKTLIKDGPKFLSHTVMISGNYAYLRPTIGSMLFCFIYIVVGAFLITLATYIMITSGKLDLAIFIGGFGVAIATFGVTLIQPFLKRARFDRKKGIFDNGVDRNVKLEQILSLQVNNKVVKRKQALNYHCYELNMLTKNGRRINVLNHNSINQILIDAQLLKSFLKIEVTDMRREIIL
jgi:hypothetical protein